MTEDQQSVDTAVEADQAAWTRPEVKRMAAGSAEAAFVSGSDGSTQNS